MSLEEFSKLARVAPEQLERYRAAALLDPEGDGLFDDYDAIRLHVINRHLDEGRTVEEIARLAQDGTIDFFGELLYGTPESTIPFEEAAERLGFTPQQLREIGTASGLPVSRMIDRQDFEAMGGVKTIIDAGIPYHAVLEVARVFGDAFRRIAQTEVRLMHDHVHERLAREGMDDREIARQTKAMMDVLSPVTERSLLFIHRQFLLRAIAGDVIAHLEAGGAHTPTTEATIVFVDLSSFTALAEIHGDEQAAETLGRFDELVRALVLAHSGALVKQIGDAFMLTFERPPDGVRFGMALAEAAAREDRFPAVRIGIHAGPVLYRVGDYVGGTVNLAHRVVSTAMPNEILVTEPVAEAARDAGIPMQAIGARALRGIEDPVPLHRVARAAPGDIRDPVCGMLLTDPAARLARDGREFAFCSEDCLRRFVEAPERYEPAIPSV